MKKLLFTMISLVLLSACAETATDVPPISETAPPAKATETIAPTLTLEPTHTPTSEPSQTPTPTPSPTLEPSLLAGPVIHEKPGPIYETVIQIPVGEDGIQYHGAGVTDMEPVGPNGLVVTADGVFVIGDVYGNRLIRYDTAGKRLDDIDLTRLGIQNISDLVGAGDALYILEISFKVLPERYRVNQLTTRGELVSQYDLPKGFHLEDGLYGLAIGYTAEGEALPLIELRPAGSRYYQVPDSPESLPEALPALPVYGKDLRQQSAGPGELAVLGAGEQEFESRMTIGGMIFLLSARLDGSLYLQREDMVAWDPVITTDITIHYISPEGKPAGVARYPLKDWYFHLWRFLTVGPDGNVYAIITREKSVDVLRLNFYQQLEPILPGAAEPVVTGSPFTPSPEPKYDCTLIQHLAPDSPEAQQIVQEFLTNFQQDWPTEYMGFEQLWAVDRLGEYAVIQGIVTQEESDIIVVQQTQRGFVMVARYTSDKLLPGLRHSDVEEYLAAQLPDAPRELFHCLDLSRFLGERE
jgi:hypothetical protein